MIPKTIDGKPIPCVSLSVNQSIVPLSNATMEVLKEDTLPIRTYVEISTPNGVTEMYRTRQPQESYTSGYATIQLDHAICEVGDFLVQDAIEEEKTVRQAIVAVFNHYRGSMWQLGSFTATETVTLDCDYDNVLETMLAILEQVPKYYLTFDFSTTPWTVSVAQKSDTVTGEGRMSRNIANDAVKTDDKDQCTRVYVKGLPKPSGRESDENAIGYMDADSATIAQYGIIEKETGSGNLTEAQATRIAQAYLAAHKHPKRSVEMDGDDLSDITGESLDSFVCGKKFRFTVPEDNLIIEDYITKVSFQDALNSSVANVIIGDEQDAAINFLQAQASSTKASRGARKKQDKENESFEKNFAKVDEHGAILEQAGMKLDSHGMIVYARDNVNNIGSILDMTASEIRSEVAAGDLQLRSEISQTASAIRLSVDNSLSDVHSSITQTADQIYSEVHTSNSAVYSFINQTATSIQSVVADVNADLHSEILQTQSMIRSAVWTANSTVYAYVDQTASYILDHVGERTGAKVFTGEDEPVDTPENPITPGDLWLEGNYINFWDDADFPWVSYDPDDPDYDWSQLRGSKLKVWKDGAWQLATDDTTFVEDTELRRAKDQINLVAYNLVQTDGELRSNIARIDVKADKISSTVNERIADVGSRITQTAYQIRSEVHSANSQLYSAIEQSATSIRAYVVDTANDLGSEILQTASQIRSEVHAAKSSLYSYVDQTATYIRSVVADTANGLSSAITQTASQIRAEVSDSVGGLSSRITQTASAIRAEVNAANSKVYSSITQTASSIRSEVANSISGVNSSITQTANQIRSEVCAANSTLYSYVDQTATSITSHVEDVANDLGSEILQTASQIRAEVHAADSTLYSYVDQTASGIRQEVANTASGLQSSINQTANKVNIIVEGTGANTHIKPAAIQAAIDAATGQSKIELSADNIILDGDAVVDALVGTDIRATGLTGTYVTADSITTNEINCDYGQVNPNTLFVSAYVENNVLHLVKTNGDEVTFSKAASGIDYLTGNWSGTASKSTLTIGTSPDTGKTYTIGFNGVYDQNLNVYSNGTPTKFSSDSKILVVPLKVVTVGTSAPYTQTTRYETTVNANASEVYNDGYNANLPSGISMGGFTFSSTIPSGAVHADGFDTNYIWNTRNDYGYVSFPITVHGQTKTFYFTYDARRISTVGNAPKAYTDGYSNGWAAAYGKNSIPWNESTANTIAVTLPANTVGDSLTTFYELTSDDTYVYLKRKDGTNRITVGRNTSSAYNNGWAAARAQVNIPIGINFNSTFSISVPSSTVNSMQTEDYAVTVDNNYAYLVRGTSDGTVTVARNTNPAYNNGWNAAYGKNSIPWNENTANTISVTVPAQTVGNSVTTFYELTSDDTYVYLKRKDGTNRITVGRNTSSAYNNGWAAARAQVNIPIGINFNSTFSISVPSSTVNSMQTEDYAVTVDNNYAYLVRGTSDGTVTVARNTNPAYNNGWNAAYGKNSIPWDSSTANTISVTVPSGTVGSSVTTFYELTSDNTYVYLNRKDGTNRITVGRNTSSAYNNGWAAGQSSVSISRMWRDGATVYARLSTKSSGSSASLGLTSHTNCVAGLSKLYDGSGNAYYGKLYDAEGNALTANNYYWYYKSSESSPTTYYS